MKKFAITMDRTMVFYVAIATVISQIYLLCIRVELNVNSYNLSFNNSFIFVHLFALGIAILILSKVITFVWIGEEKIKIGYFFPKSIRYDNIKRIDINDCIILKSENGKVNGKIRIINLQKNKVDYVKILEIIEEKTELDFKSGNFINEYNLKIKKEYTAFKGVFKYLYLYIWLGLLSSIYISIKYYIENEITVSIFILYCILILLNAVLVFLMNRRHKSFPHLINKFFLAKLIITSIFITLPNWILVFLGKANFHLITNLLWLLGITLNIILILLIRRYFIVSEETKSIFTNERAFSKIDIEKEKNNKKNRSLGKKIFIRALIGGFLVLAIIIAVNEIKYYKNVDRNYYDSIEEIINTKYSDENATYIQKGEYAYMIIEREPGIITKLILKNNDNKYLFFNDWHEETKNSKNRFEIAAYDSFRAFVFADIHEDDYIIMIERYLGDEDVKIFDNYGEWEAIYFYDNECYFEVIDKAYIGEDYEINVEIGNEVFYVVGTNEFDLAR